MEKENKVEHKKHEKMHEHKTEAEIHEHKTETNIHEKAKKIQQATEKDYIIAIVILAGIVLAYFVIVNFVPRESLQKIFESKINVEVISISADCKDCFDLTQIEKSFEKDNTKVEKKVLDYNSEEAKKLIEEYNIKTIPALVALSSNIDKLEIDKNVFSVGKDYALFDKSVPYIDINSGETKGLVSLKEIQASNCKNCISLFQIRKQIESMGIKIENYELIPDSSDSGKQLIKENTLSFAPALLISKNIEEYWWVFSQIKNSFVEMQGYYLFKTAIPPYKELSTSQIKGIVDITYIENKTCADCFNVTILKGSFQGMGVYIDNEKYVDVSSAEGKALLSQYDITAIPTIILSKEIADYETIQKTLEQVGTIEKDNNFVFRKLDVLKVKYQDLKGG